MYLTWTQKEQKAKLHKPTDAEVRAYISARLVEKVSEEEIMNEVYILCTIEGIETWDRGRIKQKILLILNGL